MQEIKLVAQGDPAVGKTCLLIVYTTKEFPTEYIPTVFDNFLGEVAVDGIPIKLNIFDTAMRDLGSRYHTLSYPGTDVFLACYSIEKPDSLQNIKKLWVPELRHHCPKASIVLVATKCDLRNSNGPDKDGGVHTVAKPQITSEDGQAMQKELDLAAFVECSALTKQNLKELFETALRLAYSPEKKPAVKKTCSLL